MSTPTLEELIQDSPHPLDDPKQARHIVEFWKRGTASSSEKAIIETYLRLDAGLQRRFAVMFPALIAALREAGYR